MISKIGHGYKLIVEKPYCCVPATIQMIFERRGLPYESQEQIGNQLGLIVPPEMASHFSNVLTGPEPVSGYGTQISKKEFSIERFFNRHNLKAELWKVSSIEDLVNIVEKAFKNGNDVAICYDSKKLFSDGDIEHFSLIQSIDEKGHLEIIDPAIGVPLVRTTSVPALFEVLNSHRISNIGGVWLISSNG